MPSPNLWSPVDDPCYHAKRDCPELLMYEGSVRNVYPRYIQEKNLQPCTVCLKPVPVKAEKTKAVRARRGTAE